MADEANISASLSIRKGNLQFRSNPTQFRASVEGSKGPTPGAVSVDELGVDIDLSELTTPGFCRLSNTSDEGIIEIGAGDGERFIPLDEIHPGEHFIRRLSRMLGQSYTGTGSPENGLTLRARRMTAGVSVLVVEAFEA